MRMLAFGIHPDDVELGCGGTVAVHARGGYDVVIVDLTRGESSSNGTPEERAAEAAAAAKVLGCRERRNLGIPDAGVQSEDPDQQRAVVEAIRELRPDVVLVPFSDDPHPDHASGGRLIERALYLAGIHGYSAAGEAWKTPVSLVYSGRREVRHELVVDISAVYDVKRRAIAAHASQFGAREGSRSTPLNAPGFLSAVEARDRSLGHAIGAQYGEAFHSVAPLRVADFAFFVAGGDDSR